MKKQFFRLFVLLGLLMLPAVSGMSLGVTKIEFDLQLNPGQSEMMTFVVENNEAMSRDISLSISDFREDVNGQMTFSDTGALESSNADWITFSPKQFTLDPRGRQEIQVTVNVPATAASGTTWSALMVNSAPTDTSIRETESDPMVVKVLQTVTSGASRNMRLENIELLNNDPLRLSVKMANTGDEVLRNILCQIEIRNTQGDTVRNWIMPPITILPGDARISEVADVDGSMEALDPGTYIALVIVDFGGDHLLASQHLFEVKAGE